MSATRSPLADGRWLFQHGPIDLVIGLSGHAAACDAALQVAWSRFVTLLPELVAELPALRTDCRLAPRVRGRVAARMVRACRRLADAFDVFVTPMAAVAGAVAEEIADCLDRPGVRRAFVNNGGDIALVLAAGESYEVGVVCDVDAPSIDARLRLEAAAPLRGIATSGRGGRSLSLGIADSVTVVAATSSDADAAATLVANAVDCDDPRIERAPADTLRDDSDLGARLATVRVPVLDVATVDAALARGAAFAQRCADAGFIAHAMLSLQGRHRVVGTVGPAVELVYSPHRPPGGATRGRRIQEELTCPPRSAS